MQHKMFKDFLPGFELVLTKLEFIIFRLHDLVNGLLARLHSVLGPHAVEHRLTLVLYS